MGKIYVGQTAIEFEVDVATDVTGATCSVKYKKPSGEEASWPAVITDAANPGERQFFQRGMPLEATIYIVEQFLRRAADA